jgi:AcrR family transcriptional regulator
MLSVQKILITSDHLFAKKGFENVSTQEISKSSKVSIGSIYHAFKKGKEDIAIALLQNYAQDLQTHFGQLLNQNLLDEEIGKSIDRIISILLELGKKYPSSFQLSKIIQNAELYELNQKTEQEICSKMAFLIRLKLPKLTIEQANIKAKICYWICDSILEKWENSHDDKLVEELKLLILRYLE